MTSMCRPWHYCSLQSLPLISILASNFIDVGRHWLRVMLCALSLGNRVNSVRHGCDLYDLSLIATIHHPLSGMEHSCSRKLPLLTQRHYISVSIASFLSHALVSLVRWQRPLAFAVFFPMLFSPNFWRWSTAVLSQLSYVLSRRAALLSPTVVSYRALRNRQCTMHFYGHPSIFIQLLV